MGRNGSCPLPPTAHCREIHAKRLPMCVDPAVPRAPTAPRISVVIPALNEAKNLLYVFASLPKDSYDRCHQHGCPH
jgi:cellulose synthase/poly-beta-1,6-N-acetylglucosamine synthase-like glycosyltransferase